MPKVNVNDIELYYESYGEGEPLIFIGGYCTDHLIWMNVLEEFSKNYRVIIFDNRGTGQSSIPDKPYSIEIFADDTIALCDSLNIKSAHFVGLSMGGMILQTLMKKYPNYVKRAVLNNSLMKTDVRFMLYAKAQLAFCEINAPIEALVFNVLPWLFSTNFLNQPGVVDSLVKFFSETPYPMTVTGIRHQLHAALHFDSSSWVQEINKPCLVMGSDEDQFVPLTVYHEMAKRIPGAHYYEFKGVGHVPSIEKPEEFVKVVMDFLN